MATPSELALWRSAGLMIRNHGSEAPATARERARFLNLAREEDGAATWQIIAERCEELLRQEGTRQ